MSEQAKSDWKGEEERETGESTPSPQPQTCSHCGAAYPPVFQLPLFEDAPDPSEILTFKEALDLVRVSRNTLYSLVRNNKIPGVRRVGNQWRFHREELLRWFSCQPSGSRLRRLQR